MDDNDSVSVWNKKQEDLTAGELLGVYFLLPVAIVGGLYTAGAAAKGVTSVASKIRTFKENRQAKKNLK